MMSVYFNYLVQVYLRTTVNVHQAHKIQTFSDLQPNS